MGLVLLLASWATLWVGPNLTPAQWIPDEEIAALIAVSFAIVLGIVAGRISSKWWYLVACAGLLSLAVVLTSAAI